LKLYKEEQFSIKVGIEFRQLSTHTVTVCPAKQCSLTMLYTPVDQQLYDSSVRLLNIERS